MLVVLQVPDEADAQKIVDRFAALASLGGQHVRPVMIHGVEGKQIQLEGLAITVVVADGKLVLSNDETLVNQALGNGEKLAVDAVYEEALDTSGAPREMSSLVYLNLKSAIPYVFDRLGAAASGSIGPDVRANTAPLHSTVLYSKQDGDRTTISGLTISSLSRDVVPRVSVHLGVRHRGHRTRSPTRCRTRCSTPFCGTTSTAALLRDPVTTGLVVVAARSRPRPTSMWRASSRTHRGDRLHALGVGLRREYVRRRRCARRAVT